ncbi:MAG: methionine adenosyltransferase [Candidatus Hermodarchaeia archaeon]
MSDRVISEEPKVREIAVKILTRIGYPIDQPLIAATEIIPDEHASWSAVAKSVKAIVDAELEDVCSIQQLIIDGKARLF